MLLKTNVYLLFCLGALATALPVGAQSLPDRESFFRDAVPARNEARSSSAARVLVVVDYERQVALVPHGTILPGDLELSSCIGGRAIDSSGQCRPLVFAYAPESTFAAIRAFNEKLARGSGPMSVQKQTLGRGGVSVLSVHGCPDSVMVEFGPDPPYEFFHLVTCEEDQNDPDWKLIDWSVYYIAVDEAEHRQSYVYDSQLYYMDTFTCDPGDETTCTDAAWWNGGVVTQVNSRARVKDGSTYWNTITYTGW